MPPASTTRASAWTTKATTTSLKKSKISLSLSRLSNPPCLTEWKPLSTKHKRAWGQSKLIMSDAKGMQSLFDVCNAIQCKPKRLRTCFLLLGSMLVHINADKCQTRPSRRANQARPPLSAVSLPASSPLLLNE